MKRHIGTGKTVQKIEYHTSNKIKVYYTDLSSEEMTHKDFKLLIREIKS